MHINNNSISTSVNSIYFTFSQKSKTKLILPLPTSPMETFTMKSSVDLKLDRNSFKIWKQVRDVKLIFQVISNSFILLIQVFSGWIFNIKYHYFLSFLMLYVP